MFVTTETSCEDETGPMSQSSSASISATELWSDAQILDNSPSLKQSHSPHVKLAEHRSRSWPRFFVLWQIIGSVSAYDAFLAMKYRADLPYLERNLVGQLLLEINGDDPSLLVGVKFLGTMMVLGILSSLFNSRPERAMMVAYGVTACQISLLAYLTWG